MKTFLAAVFACPATNSRTSITLCGQHSPKGLVPSSTLHSTSTQKRLAINYSSSLIVKTLIVCLEVSSVLTSLSLVVHSAALSFSSLAFVLAALRKHSLAPRPRGTHAIYSDCVHPCFARPQIPSWGLSSRAPPDLTKTSSIDTVRQVVACIHHYVNQPCKCFNAAISQAMHVLRNCFSCLQLGSFRSSS